MYWIAGVLGVVIVLLIIYRLASRSASEATEDGQAMPLRARRFLVGYLLAVGLLLIYLMIELLRIDYPETPLVFEAPAQPAIPVVEQPTPGETPPVPANANQSPDTVPPTLLAIFPSSTLGADESVQLVLYGADFKPDASVLLNKQQRKPDSVETRLIRITPQRSDLVGTGLLVLEVRNGNGRVSNAMTVRVVRPLARFQIFGMPVPITREVQLALLVLFAGALGSIIHTLQSLADFLGNRTLTGSWFWWYVTRPFLGMAIAFVVYAVLRAGFLTGTPADVRVVNPFGAIAVAALVGTFSDKALLKLAEIFETLFRADDKRGGKLAAPVIDKLEPAFVQQGSAGIELIIKGERLAKVNAVKVGDQERQPKRVGEGEVVIDLTAADLRAKAKVPIAVVSEGQSSPARMLIVTDLAIATAQLAGANTGAAYNEPVRATGGTQPYTWSLKSGPEWLKLDAKSGILSGTPADAGRSPVEIQVSDSDNASALKPFEITVA